MITTLVILLVAIVAFVSNTVAPPVVALGVALALYVTGTVSMSEALAGFSDPVVIYLAALYVVSEALDATGVTAWAGQQLTRRVGKNRAAVLATLMLLCAALTALISVNGAVAAALVPVAVILASRIGEPPSQILMPLAFAAHAGSMLTLLGTPGQPARVGAGGEGRGPAVRLLRVRPRRCPVTGGHRPDRALPGAAGLAPPGTGERPTRSQPARRDSLAAHYAVHDDQTTISHNRGVTEVVIPPRSRFEGDPVFPGMRTDSGDLVVVAVHRGGDDVGSTRLRAGDVLVLRGPWDALDRRVAHPGLMAVDAPSQLRRYSIELGARSYTAIAILTVMCLLLALGTAPAAIVALTAAAAVVALRVITIPEAQHAISLPTLLIVTGMVPLSTAMQTSGLADYISDGLLATLGSSSPILLQLGIVLTVVVLGQFISNLATVLIVSPIAMTVAATADVSPLPLLMGITLAGAASFITPVATAANLMIQEPGAYRFGDYWKLGLPNLALFVLVATLR